MFNATIPTRSELPTSAQLVRSTIIAAGVAAALLVTVVLPSEYAVDPTGIGSRLGLTEMGEIKAQLAQEAAADRAADSSAPEASAATAAVTSAALPTGQATAAVREDAISVTLKPGEGAEVKLVMREGEKSDYVWKVAGGTVNADVHGDGSGQAISYAKVRGLAEDRGTLTAAFTGNHGWYWRNRGTADVVVTLQVRGRHSQIKRVA